MTQFHVAPGQDVRWGDGKQGFAAVHVFDELEIRAIEAALGAQRPLLLLGEPGVGKSQLARAAAEILGWNFCSLTVDAHTEARDLKWSEDLVARLAKAQILGALRSVDDDAKDNAAWLSASLASVDMKNFVRPGPLWWAFDWESASKQAERANAPIMKNVGDANPKNRTVVLIDEIDKAQSELPNGLLEALGQREFTPTGYGEPVRAQDDNWPLVILTSNEERRMPDAFIRRCVVHRIRMPETPDHIIAFLIDRGAKHFSDLDQDTLKIAAEMTVADRQTCKDNRLFPLPGQAEYLDLLRAFVSDDTPADSSASERLKSLQPFFLHKHADFPR